VNLLADDLADLLALAAVESARKWKFAPASNRAGAKYRYNF